MTFSRNRTSNRFYYTINPHPFTVDSIRDLKLFFITSLNTKAHVDNVTCNLFRMQDCIKRIADKFKLAILLKSLNYRLVRSILEYGSVVGDP